MKRDTLRPEHARFVELRLEGTSVERCASALGVDRATAFRWAAREDVRAALADGQAAGREVAAVELAALAPKAAKALGELLKSEDDRTRLRAAEAVLERAGVMAPVPGDGEPIKVRLELSRGNDHMEDDDDDQT